MTVTAAEDGDAVADADVTLVHAVSGTGDYASVTADSVTVTITEKDAVGVSITPTTLTVTEGDATGVSYTVVLTSQPDGDVTVTVSGYSGYRPVYFRHDPERGQRADLHHGELGHSADGDGEGRRGRRRGDGRRRDPDPRHQQHGRLDLRRTCQPERHRTTTPTG